MTPLPILLSSATYNSMLIISIPNKVVANQHAKNNIPGRTMRVPAHSTRHTVVKPSAMMVDDTSSNIAKDVRQPSTIYTPSIWGDIFSTFCFDDQVQQKYSEEIEALKKEVRSMLMGATSTKLIILIDKLERLGLAYHFETEIEEKLEQVYDAADEEEEKDYDLFTTALRFRLLRQNQFQVSCDAFAKFVSKDNKLKENLASDVDGLLSLYEAAYVRFHDEDILEQAVAFTTHHLSHMLPQLECPLKQKEVKQALQFPLHKTPTIVMLRSNIDIYQNDSTRNETLLRLAKLNFNFMQNIFRNELFQLTTWWNEFNVSQIPCFRDRLVENYLWTLSHHFEPHYSLVRTVATKLYETITVMNDAYDNYATLEETELLTQAIERWNVDEIEKLHDYQLKVVFKLIMSCKEEFEREAEKQGKSYFIPYYTEAVKQVGRGYAQEEKWKREKQMPSFEERMFNTRFTTLMYIMFTTVMALMKSGTKETLDWLLSDPEIVMASSDIIRLNDDLFTYERESRGGTVKTCMDYYMKDKGLSSVQEAESAYRKLLEERWKDLSAAWVNCKGTVPKEIVVQIMDLARMCTIMFLNDLDNLDYPEKNNMAPLMTALFLDPIII